MKKSKSLVKKEISEVATELDKKELAFCHHYLLNGNRAAAIKHAGFDTQNASKYAYDLLNRSHIQQYISLERQIYEEEQRDRYFQTKYKKMDILWKTLNELLPQLPERPDLARIVCSIIAELNKMEGHYAAEKHLNVNVNYEEELRMARERMPEFFVGY